MSSGGLKVDFGGLDSISADIKSGAGKLQSRLDQMDQELAPMKSEWTGAAAESYQQAKAKWTQAIEDMNQLLQQISSAVSDSNQQFQAGEQANANRW